MARQRCHDRRPDRPRSSTICASAPRPAKKTSMSPTKERNRDVPSIHPASGTARSSGPHPALHISRAPRSLARGALVHLLASHRSGVLVSVVILARRNAWRRAGLAHVASVDRADLFRRHRANVCRSGRPRWASLRSRPRSGSARLAITSATKTKICRPAGRYNAGQKLLFWGFIVFGTLLLLSGLVLWFPEYIPWNLRVPALHRRAGPRLLGAGHHRPFPDPRLHGRLRRARRHRLRHSR